MDNRTFESILQTKILLPTRPGTLVERSRLTSKLQLGQETRKLSLVCAPAGFGKTTAVLAWLYQPQVSARVAWFSIEEADDEPLRFWHYLLRAIETGLALPERRLVNKLLPSQQLPPVEHLFTGLINELVSFNEPLIVVLDDYHFINAPQIQRGISFLLDHQPPGLHLVITSRSEPPLPLSRMRIRRQLTELRMDDLRFNLDEATQLLNTASGLSLPPRIIAQLENKTEGWVAALQLSAVLLQNRRDIDSFILSFNGGQRFMLDYLAEEVLQNQPEVVQNFLLQTALVERFNASLAEELTGCEDGQAMLDQLYAANLFLVPLDDEPGWYRYHYLFRQYLYNRLEQTQVDHLPLLHRWAGNWYAELGRQHEAIEHLLKGQSYDLAVELIDQTVEELYQKSDLKTLLGWFSVLPREALYRHPHTSLYYAWVLIFMERPKAALPYLELAKEAVEKARVENSLPALTLETFQAEILATQAIIDRKTGNFSEAIRLGNQALLVMPPAPSFLRCAVTMNQAHSYAALADINEANRYFNLTEKLGRASGSNYFLLLGIVSLARLYLQYGKLHLALATCQRAFQMTELQALPVMCLAYFVRGSIWREWNDLEAAAQSLLAGIALAESTGTSYLLDGYIELALVRQAQGDEVASQDYLAQAQRMVYNFDSVILLRRVQQAHGRCWLARNDLADVEAWAARLPYDDARLPLNLDEIDQLLLARLYLAQSQPTQALELLNRSREAAPVVPHINLAVESLTLKACALYRLGQPEAATQTLAQALQLAEPEGFVRLFIDSDAALPALLLKLAEPSKEPKAFSPDYLAKIQPAPTIKLVAQPVSQIAPAPRKPVLIEPITEREREVLRLLVSTTLSSSDISEQLVIAVSTVRSHIKSIYSKLDVQNRLGAIARTRELELLNN